MIQAALSIPKLSEIIPNNNPLAKLLLVLSVTKSLKRKRVKRDDSRCARNKARPKSAYRQVQGRWLKQNCPIRQTSYKG